jgi:hypothetical protein
MQFPMLSLLGGEYLSVALPYGKKSTQMLAEPGLLARQGFYWATDLEGADRFHAGTPGSAAAARETMVGAVGIRIYECIGALKHSVG